MRRMSWIRSSKGVTLVVLFAVSLAAVGGATALSVSADGIPSGTQVGDPVEVTITIEDPFVDKPDQWTLAGSTELRNASWRITILQQGETIADGDRTTAGSSFEQPLNSSRGGDTVRITVAGDTPPVGQFGYQSNETFTLYDIEEATGNSTIDINDSEVYHYTNKSRAAREEIMRAQAVLNETDGSDEARQDLNNAIEFYNSERFDRAISLAESAQDKAESSQQSSQLLLFAGVGVVVLLIVAGGVYYYRSQQDDYSKLQ
jgi:hypothetical protein